jgi:cell division protein FtsQ
MWDDAKALNAAAITLAALAIVALLAGAVLRAVRLPIFAFRDVVVTAPLARASAAHVEAVLRSELHGTFFTLDFDAARAALRDVPWVKQVALRGQGPARLEVTIDEYLPLALWNDNALVDPDGAVFAAGYDGELPQLEGPDGRAPDVVARYRAFRDVLAPLGLALTSLTLTPRGSWSLKAAGASGSMAIALGRADVDVRLARLASVYPRTIGALLRAGRNVEYVDLRYRAGFAARVPGLRDKPARNAA